MKNIKQNDNIFVVSFLYFMCEILDRVVTWTFFFFGCFLPEEFFQ